MTVTGQTVRYLVRASENETKPEYALIVEVERDDPGLAIRGFLEDYAFTDSKLTVTAERVR